MRASSGRARIFWCSKTWFFFDCLLFLTSFFIYFFFMAALHLKHGIVGALMVFRVSVFSTINVTTLFALKRKRKFLSAYFTVRHRNHLFTISCLRQLLFMNHKFSSQIHIRILISPTKIPEKLLESIRTIIADSNIIFFLLFSQESGLRKGSKHES